MILRITTAALMLSTMACTTTAPLATQTPAPEPAVVSCNPAHALVNSVLWVQTAAEYDAAAVQAFNSAKRALDEALADPSWVGAAEESGNDPAQPPAVILDLDETAIDNSAFEARTIRVGKTYDEEIWKQWTAEANAGEVPGAADFLAYAKSRSVTPFYITNRDNEEKPGTRANLEKLGYPLGTEVDTLLLRGDRPEWGSDKSTRRAYVASSYRVLLVLGDDLNDFASAREKTIAQRDEIIANTREWWGRRWFIIPNPMYGSWERAAITSGGTPCEQLEKKVQALRP